MAWPESETDLAPPVIAWLEEDGWEVFQEVVIYQGSPRADLVATKHGLVWVLELKKTLSLDLLDQTAHWTRYAHYSSAVVPQSKKRYSRNQLVFQICEWKGIGLLEVGPPSTWHNAGPNVGKTVEPRLHRKAMVDKVRDALRPQHKDFAQAGNANGKFWSRFRQTCQDLARVVELSPGITMKQAIERIDHHYSSLSSARTSLALWIERGKVEHVKMRLEGGQTHLYPC